jgi:hypothetical protein
MQQQLQWHRVDYLWLSTRSHILEHEICTGIESNSIWLSLFKSDCLCLNLIESNDEWQNWRNDRTGEMTNWRNDEQKGICMGCSLGCCWMLFCTVEKGLLACTWRMLWGIVMGDPDLDLNLWNRTNEPRSMTNQLCPI